MAAKINFINNIPLPVPERKILHRLGHNRHLTEMSDRQRQNIHAAIAQGALLCKLRGVWARFEINKLTAGKVEFGEGHVFESRKLAELLKGCKSLALFAVTAGMDIVEHAAELSASGDGVGALAYDAAGSETAEAAAEWLRKYLNQQFKRSNEVLTKRRFSPGYGDLALKSQAVLFKLLDLEKIGVRLTDDFIMIPEKTVTAITGIKVRN